jgi:hypothetical protein
MNVKSLLLEHYLAWQQQEGEIGTWKHFASMIGIDHVYLNKIYNGKRKAGEKIVQQLADYFKDDRFYDAAGLDRPDKRLAYARRNWPALPENIKKLISESISHYTPEKLPDDS